MVRGLIGEQDVGIQREDLGERDAHLPAATEALHGPMLIFGRDAEAREHFLCAVIEVVAIAALEFLLRLALLL